MDIDCPPDHEVHCLVLDLNSFFASCEQQENPALRGRPVGIVPMENVDSTCILAASYEAKRFGIKTGTPVFEAKAKCPDIVLMKASHKIYVRYHHKVIAAIERCTPIEKVMSIDEVSCRLTGSQRDPKNAWALAERIKQTIQTDVGACLTSSVGIASNTLLAKLASNMQKPDGLTLIRPCDIPTKLLPLPLRAFSGVGPAMETRLNRSGIFSMKDLYACDRNKLRRIWGGVEGARFHGKIWGQQIERAETQRRVLGHQHVLEPQLRNMHGAYDVLHHLTVKGTERLRAIGFYCTHFSLQVKLDQRNGYWEKHTNFAQTQDTQVLLGILQNLWKAYHGARPLRVGIMLSGLVEANAHQPDLFDKPKPVELFKAIDGLNGKFGRHTVSFGLNAYVQERAGKDKIAFQSVSDTAYL